jgi:hypothetical protein
MPTDGLLLFHAASCLRAHQFNYISLGTVLSDSGIISQSLNNGFQLCHQVGATSSHAAHLAL